MSLSKFNPGPNSDEPIKFLVGKPFPLPLKQGVPSITLDLNADGSELLLNLAIPNLHPKEIMAFKMKRLTLGFYQGDDLPGGMLMVCLSNKKGEPLVVAGAPYDAAYVWHHDPISIDTFLKSNDAKIVVLLTETRSSDKTLLGILDADVHQDLMVQLRKCWAAPIPGRNGYPTMLNQILKRRSPREHWDLAEKF